MSEIFGFNFNENAEFNPMREPENNLSFDFSFDEFVESEEPKMTLDALVEQLKEDNGIEVFEKDSVKQKVLEDICSRGSGYNLRQVSGLIDSGLFTEEEFLLYFREKLKIEMEDNIFIFELLEFYTLV